MNEAIVKEEIEEQKKENKSEEIEEDEGQLGWLVNQKEMSIAIACLIGLLLFVIEMLLRGG